jgi:hypothetical protein
VRSDRFDRHEHERVLMLLALVGLALDARRTLLDAIERRRKLEAQLADPALADHPKRDRAERQLPARWEAERRAIIRLAEAHAGIGAEWDAISPQEKNRFALTTILGESDPTCGLGMALWGNRGVWATEPIPNDWSIPHDIAHRATDFGIRTYTPHELLQSDVARF